MKIRLHVALGQESTFQHESTGPVLTLGRDPASGLSLQGDAAQPVSWSHARIEWAPAGLVLSDVGSTNGTFLNGQKLTEPAKLRVGDEFRLGQSGPRIQVMELAELPIAAPPPPANGERTLDEARPRRSEPTRAPAAPAPRPARKPAAAPQQGGTLLGAALGVAGVSLLVVVLLVLRGGINPNVPAPQPLPPAQTAAPPPSLPPPSVPEPTPPAEKPVPKAENPAPSQPAVAVKTDVASASPARTPTPQPPPETTPPKPAPSPPTRPVESPSEPVPSNEGASGSIREVGRYVVPEQAPGILLQRQRETEPWGQLLADNRVSTGYHFVSLPGYRSKMRLNSGIDLTLWGNLPQFSVFPPVLESAVMLLEPAAGFDLDFTLDRGRVQTRQIKSSGAARVRMRFLRETWDLTLADRNTEAVLELWGLHPPDVPFRLESGGGAPLLCAGLFVKGSAQLKTPRGELSLKGPCRVVWRSDSQSILGPEPLSTLPDWWADKLSAESSPALRETMLLLTYWDARLSGKDTVVDELLTGLRDNSAAPGVRTLGALFLQALDAVPHLLDALEDPQPDVRAASAAALHHWMDRSGDHKQELLRELQQRRGYSRPKAEIILRLLHGYGGPEARKPETYALLISYLDHDNLPVRDLARRNLERLTPTQAAKVPYDPMAGSDKRKEAVVQWQKLIPPGKLPPP